MNQNSIELLRVIGEESIKTSLSAFLCKQCSNLPLEIFACTNINCGEYFCGDCNEKACKNYCSSCKGELANSNSLMIKVFKQILIECENKNSGCQEKVRAFELKNHQKDCIYRRIKCSSKNCDFTDSSQNIKSHELICEKFLIPCPNCNELIERKANNHESVCNEKPAICNFCNLSFLRKYLDDHYSICEFYEIQCDICKLKYSRNSVEIHSCLTSLGTYVQTNYKNLDERLSLIETKVNKIENIVENFENKLSDSLKVFEERILKEINRKELVYKKPNEEKSNQKLESIKEDLVKLGNSENKQIIEKILNEFIELKNNSSKKLECSICEQRAKMTLCKSCNNDFCSYCITKCKNCNLECCLECLRMTPNCKPNCLNIFCKVCFEKRQEQTTDLPVNSFYFFKCKVCSKMNCKSCGNQRSCKICNITICSDCIKACSLCYNDVCLNCFSFYNEQAHKTTEKLNSDFKNCSHIHNADLYMPLLIGGYDGKVLNYHLLSSKIMNIYQTHNLKSYVTSIEKFGDKIVTSSSDGYLRIWKDKTFTTKLYEYSNNDKHNIHPFNQTIAINENLVASCSSTKRQAMIFYSDGNNVTKPIKKIEVDSNLNSLSKFNENIIFLGGSNIYFWYLNKNEIISKLNIHDNFQVYNILKLRGSYSSHIASNAGDNKLKIWNDKGKVIVTFEENLGSSSNCKIGELIDGRVVASSNDFKIKLFDIKSKDIVEFKGHNYFVHDFSVINEYYFASCSGDYTVNTWDLRKNEKVSSYTFDDFYPMRLLNQYDS